MIYLFIIFLLAGMILIVLALLLDYREFRYFTISGTISIIIAILILANIVIKPIPDAKQDNISDSIIYKPNVKDSIVITIKTFKK